MGHVKSIRLIPLLKSSVNHFTELQPDSSKQQHFLPNPVQIGFFYDGIGTTDGKVWYDDLVTVNTIHTFPAKMVILQSLNLNSN